MFGRKMRRPNAVFPRKRRPPYPTAPAMHLDRFDRQLLNLVQDDAAMTAEQMAEHVSLSPSAIQRRLRRLRDEGVILREVAVLDPRRVAGSNVFVVSVQVERERPELLAQFRDWLAGEEAVQQAFYVTGEADFILIVAAPSTEAYDALMSRMMSANANVKRFTTSVALNVVKRGLRIPVSLHDER
jgi:Lrp/AsnC family leucine-responsive transcriptional regulator